VGPAGICAGSTSQRDVPDDALAWRAASKPVREARSGVGAPAAGEEVEGDG